MCQYFTLFFQPFTFFQIGSILCSFCRIISLWDKEGTESHRFGIKTHQKRTSRRCGYAFARLNSNDKDSGLVGSEMADVQTNLDNQLTHEIGSYLDRFKIGERKSLHRTLTEIAPQGLQQLTGNPIFYSETIFFQAISSGNLFIFITIPNVFITVTARE